MENCLEREKKKKKCQEKGPSAEKVQDRKSSRARQINKRGKYIKAESSDSADTRQKAKQFRGKHLVKCAP